MKVLLIAGAGALGALTRFGIGSAVGVRSFPWATLGINLAGSFLLGLVVAAGAERQWSDLVMAPVAAGFLGAFTTFSTFSVETNELVRSDRPGAALLYVSLSLVGGLLAACVGYLVARAVA